MSKNSSPSAKYAELGSTGIASDELMMPIPMKGVNATADAAQAGGVAAEAAGAAGAAVAAEAAGQAGGGSPRACNSKGRRKEASK